MVGITSSPGRPVESWTWQDVKAWLQEQPALAKYAKNQLKGTTGMELVAFTDKLLQDIDIKNPLHRLQLLNRRNELLAQEAEGPVPAPTPALAAPKELLRAPSRRVKISRHATPPEDTTPAADEALPHLESIEDTDESDAPTKASEVELVTLGDAGPEIAHSTLVPVAARRLISEIVSCHRLAGLACYNASNCEIVEESLVELQTLLLQNEHLLRTPGLLPKLYDAIAVTSELFAAFSGRGWLSRLDGGELQDCQAFEHLDALLMGLAKSCGVDIMDQEPQEFSDDTGQLQRFLQGHGGFSRLKAAACGSLKAFAQMEPYLSQAVKLLSTEELEEEATWSEAVRKPGAHSVLRNASMSLLWFKHLPKQDEVSWDTFWTHFPNNVDRGASSELHVLFTERANRDTLQAAIGRTSPQLVTAAELDFHFPPERSVLESCTHILSSLQGWRALSRGPPQAGATVHKQGSGPNKRPENLVLPSVREPLRGLRDALEELCELLKDSTSPVQLVTLTGGPGIGKVTAAVSAAQMLVTSACWESAYWADLTGCTTATAATFALLAAFGVPADTPDMNPLQVFMARNAQLPLGLLLRMPKDLPPTVEVQLTSTLQAMFKAAPLLQVVVCAESAFQVANVNAAEFEMQPLPEEDSQALLQACSVGREVQDVDLVSEACRGGPLTLRLVAAALCEGLASEDEVLTQLGMVEAGPTDSPLPKWIMHLLLALPDEQLLRIITLSIFPADFDVAAAAKVLGQAACPTKTSSLLRELHRLGLSEAAPSRGRWRLHASVRDAATELAAKLQLPLIAARVSRAEHHTKVLLRAAAVQPFAPVAAARLVARDAHNIWQSLSRAARRGFGESSADGVVAAELMHRYLPALVSLIWDCMQLLGPWLQSADRIALCQLLIDGSKATRDQVSEGRALWQLGASLTDAGSWREAEPPLTEALALLEAEHGPFHLDIARVCSSLAIVYYKVGLLEKAQDMYARAYDIQSAKLGPEHPEVASTMNHTAGLLKVMGKFGDAESVYRTVLAMRERELGPDHLEVAASLNNLAVLLKTTGANEEAETLLQRSIRIKETALGPKHPQVALSLNNLAALLRQMDRKAQAEEMYRKALAIREDALGLDHPQVAASYANLAGMLRSLGRAAEALPFQRKALDIKSRALPANHPELAAAQLSLAELLKDLGQFAEALKLCEAAVAKLKVAVGPDNPNVATALAIKVGILRSLGRPEEAEQPARKALAIREAAFGTESKEAASAYHCMAETLADLRRYEDAEEACRNAMEVREEKCGPVSPITAASLELLAVIMRETDRAGEAETILRSCLLIHEGKPPADTLEVASVLVELAALLHENGNLQEAEELSRRALAIRDRILGAQHPDVAAALLGLGIVILKDGRQEEAKPQIHKAVQICTLKLGKDHPTTVSARDWLAKCKEPAALGATMKGTIGF